MSRKRLTWGDEARRASAAPATPNEGPASPAHKPDPEADAYENGDTSSWAEDVHPGPYPNSAHPATPDEGPASPAYKAAALERKAAKCIRIATSMLGDPEGDPAKVAAIEDQALALMDLPDTAIKASLTRLGQDDDEEMDEEEEESSKKASLNKAAMGKIASNAARIARLERILIKLAQDEDEEEEVEEEVEESSKKASEDELLEQMLVEEGMGSGMYMDEGPMDDEAMLEQMMKEEGMGHDSEMAMEEDAPMAMDEEVDMSMSDPMGMSDMTMDADEQMILASLFNKQAEDDDDDDDDDEEEVEEVEEEVEESSKKASLRPQPKKASQGAKKLGGPVSKEASSEVKDLSQLWETAPDVSRFFG
jgi:hypothetical protein